MSQSQPTPFDPPPERANEASAEEAGPPSISLDQLSSAFAEMLGVGEQPQETEGEASEADASQVAAAAGVDEEKEDDACEITPRSILEAMLFVGSPHYKPLSADQAASLLRGVQREEVDSLVVELNREYAREGTAFEIVSEGAGYRLALRNKYRRVRDKFYGRVRQAKLSQSAIEVLSVVAYNQPVTTDQVNKFRAAPSGPILAQLVRRQLLRIERPESGPRNPLHFTTDRFLQLFDLANLDDLPRSEELDGK